MSGEPLFKLVNEIKPSELILPDVLQDGEQTTKNSFDFFKKFFKDELRPPKFMVVPQGKTWDEYMSCFNEFRVWGLHSVIGIPYDIEFNTPGNYTEWPETEEDTPTSARAKRRLTLIRQLSTLGRIERPVHLLGMNNLWELRESQKKFDSSLIRSNDTTAPFAAASDGRCWFNGDSGEKSWSPLDFEVEWDGVQVRNAHGNLFEYVLSCNDIQAMYKYAEVNSQSPNKIRPNWDSMYV